MTENPYPNLKSNGTPKVTTTSAFFKACFLLCLKKYLSDELKHPLAIPEVYTGADNLSKLFKHIDKNSLFCVTWFPKRKTGFFALTILKAALSILCWSSLNAFTGLTFIEDFFEENKSFKCLLTYHWAIFPKKPLFGSWFINSYLIASSGYNKSIGSSTNTGPGTPEIAVLMALASVGITSLVFFTLTADFTYVFNNEIWSISWSDPLPFNNVAAAPPIKSTGDCAICAFLIAVTVLVTPGPAVTIATPIESVNRETASAAKTAETSSLTWMISIFSFSQPTNIGEMWPPHRVKIEEIFFCLKKEPISSPICSISELMTSYYLKPLQWILYLIK